MCAPPVSIAATPLENLKKLEEAEKIIKEAEHAQAAGKMDKACELYQKAQYLCPDSRLAAIAHERVQVLSAVKKVQEQTTTATTTPVGEPYSKSYPVADIMPPGFTRAGRLSKDCLVSGVWCRTPWL